MSDLHYAGRTRMSYTPRQRWAEVKSGLHSLWCAVRGYELIDQYATVSEPSYGYKATSGPSVTIGCDAEGRAGVAGVTSAHGKNATDGDSA